MKRLAVRYAMVALLILGSATLLFSCADSEAVDNSAAEEAMMTEYSENLSIIMSRNGLRSYFFTTPLVEGYILARDPYREFRKGVKIVTYQDDSLSAIDAVLTANYAIFYEKRQLWEAKGNVVVEKSDGKQLYTQQLFWNQRTKKIYSNVDTKIVQSGGRDVFIGEGFESDEEFTEWRFRRMKGRMEVDVSPSETADSTARENSTVDSPSATAAASRRNAASNSNPALTPAGSAASKAKPASMGSPEMQTPEIQRGQPATTATRRVPTPAAERIPAGEPSQSRASAEQLPDAMPQKLKIDKQK